MKLQLISFLLSTTLALVVKPNLDLVNLAGKNTIMDDSMNPKICSHSTASCNSSQAKEINNEGFSAFTNALAATAGNSQVQ
jgi:hypothetical protein